MNGIIDRTGVWGRSGSGKSSWVKRVLAGRGRVIVYDPLGEYGAAGCRVMPHDRADALDRVRVAIRDAWDDFRLAYVPPAGREPAALDRLSRLLLRIQRHYQATGQGRPITLVVEEANLAFPTSGGVERCPGFAEICSRGRHYGLEVIGVSQRIAEVATRFRGNCSRTVVFAQKGPRDVSAAAAELGVTPAEVEALEPFEYLLERGGKVEKGRLPPPGRGKPAARAKKSQKT